VILSSSIAYTKPFAHISEETHSAYSGRIRAATISLKGRLTEAHPPGATMAVRENKLSCEGSEVKTQARIDKHFFDGFAMPTKLKDCSAMGWN
jgi:hypothetical protein